MLVALEIPLIPCQLLTGRLEEIAGRTSDDKTRNRAFDVDPHAPEFQERLIISNCIPTSTSLLPVLHIQARDAAEFVRAESLRYLMQEFLSFRTFSWRHRTAWPDLA
jgi:hypothetical protein